MALSIKEIKMAAGNIKAIGDWFKSRTYDKNAIEDFFLNIDSGYKAYKFEIYGGDEDGIISFEGQTSGKEYAVNLDSNGNGSALLFFTQGEYVDYICGEKTGSIELTTREITISFGYSEDYYIDVYTMPTKTEYYVGEAIDTTGLVIHKYRISDNADLGEVTVYSNSQHAELHTGIECAFYNAYADEANLQLFHHNGTSRTPTIKPNAGRSIIILARNGGGTNYGGDWNYPISYSDDYAASIIADGQTGSPASLVINGMQWYVMYLGQNPRYAGFTDQSTYINDGGYPEIKDVQIADPVQGFSEGNRKKLFRYLHAKFVGGAVTIQARDENGMLMECQYGVIVYPGIPLIPKMTGEQTPSGRASASSMLNTNFYPWFAFDRNECNLSTLSDSWLPTAADSTPYLKYEFPSAVTMDLLRIVSVNNSTTTQKPLIIEGSNDDSTYTNILNAGNTVFIDFVNSKRTQTDIELNGGSYKYLRISCNEPLYGGNNQYACGFEKVQVFEYT